MATSSSQMIISRASTIPLQATNSLPNLTVSKSINKCGASLASLQLRYF